MSATEPWQTAEFSGTKKAMVIAKPEVAVAMIKKANHPILVIGHLAAEIELEGKMLIDYLIDFARKSKIPVIATAHIVGEFLKRGFEPAGWMSATEIGSKLADPEWHGIDCNGPHDVALFVGLPYYMESLILSGLKSFAPKLKTITLDNKYHPHASWSFPNASVKDWAENLKIMISKFEERGRKQRNVNV